MHFTELKNSNYFMRYSRSKSETTIGFLWEQTKTAKKKLLKKKVFFNQFFFNFLKFPSYRTF